MLLINAQLFGLFFIRIECAIVPTCCSGVWSWDFSGSEKMGLGFEVHGWRGGLLRGASERAFHLRSDGNGNDGDAGDAFSSRIMHAAMRRLSV